MKNLYARYALPILFVALSLALSLGAGCRKAATDKPAEPGETAAVATHEVTDMRGKTLTIPTAPKRIVVLSEVDLDIVLALGVTPVASTDGRGQAAPPRYLGERAAKVPSIGGFMRPSLDAILAQEPDLILAGGYANADLLEQLEKVAPTVVSFGVGDTWQDVTTRIGGYLNRQAEAAAVIAGYEARCADLKASWGEYAGATVSIVRWNPKGPMYMLHDSFASVVIRDAGLTRPEAQREPGQAHSPPLSLESLALIDGDWLCLGTLQAADESADSLQNALSTPVFQRLGAAQAGHVLVVDGSAWTSIGGPLAALHVLKDMEDAILKKTAAKP